MSPSVIVPPRLSALLLCSLVFPFSLIPLACGPDEAQPSRLASVRDSAGIRIVTYPSGVFQDTVPREPVLTIGREGDLDYEFFRISSIVGLASGNVVVANGGTYELRFFDKGGRFLRTVGRNGEGPAEFGFLSGVWVRPGDTLVVNDPGRRRLVYFDSAGAFIRGESYAGDLDNMPGDGEATGPCIFPSLQGLLGEGKRLIHGWGCMQFRGGTGRRPTLLDVDVVGPDGRRNLGAFNVAWVWERGRTDDPRNAYSMIPFQGAMRTAAGADRIYLSQPSEYEIQAYAPDGTLVSLLREDTVPPAVTETDLEMLLAGLPEGRNPFAQDVPLPERFGSYDQLLISHEGDLWARHFRRPGVPNQRWVVFPAGDGDVRRVVLPDLQVESIRDGRIYGRRSDSLGIERVVVLDAGVS